ncbi:MAG: ComEC/Rec2 family competence protein [Bacteroidales bacterium]|nr:ComEC/Rec2 family competence protein [Bacteroidales bacterium]
MYDLRKLPVLRALVPFFGGVVCGTACFTSILPWRVLIMSLIIWTLALFLYFRQGSRTSSHPWLLPALLFLLIFVLGWGNAMLSKPADPGFPIDERVLVRGEVSGAPIPGPQAHSFDLEVHLLVSGDSRFRVHTHLRAYFRIQADSLIPDAGEIWQFSGKLAAIQNNGNPGEFDYKSLMSRRNCWYRFYISTGEESDVCNRRIEGDQRRLSSSLIRKRITGHWHGDTEEISLLKAVCLGDRSSLTDELRQVYTAAGGMHLLAVSGLHVGLIWWVLQYMTAWMYLLFRSEKQKTVAILGLLWFYAFVTGFSSSVSRAVCMFSFFSAGRILGKRIHPLNVVFVSAFLLVLIQPVRLLDVGFQLSYCAITGIVSFFPLLKNLTRIKNRLLRKIWEAASVSLAAQLSTAPLVIYYFHQLPLYSLLTSLIAIPLLSVLISVFVCSVPFISAGILEDFFNFLLVGLARLMNGLMDQISTLPGALPDGLQMDLLSLSVGLLILLLLATFLHGNRRIPPYLILLLISVSLIWSSTSSLKCQHSSELIITHFRGASMIIFRQGRALDQYCWYRDSSSRDYMKAYSDGCWSRRRYQKQLYAPEEAGSFSERISGCVWLAEGLWLLGNDLCSGLVFGQGLEENRWGSAFGDSANALTFTPCFILLSGEPEPGSLQEVPWRDQTDLVIDGSNRSWYKDRLDAGWDGSYLTDRSGAYVKRW